MLFYRVLQHPISTLLEELHSKKKQELMTPSPTVRPPTTAEPVTTNKVAIESECTKTTIEAECSKTTVAVLPEEDKTGSTKKKRSAQDVTTTKSAEDWFRTKTSIPPHLIGVIRKSQELVANDMKFQPEFRKKIETQASGGGVLDSTGPASPCSIIAGMLVFFFFLFSRTCVNLMYIF
jgi:hypothetical protein